MISQSFKNVSIVSQNVFGIFAEPCVDSKTKAFHFLISKFHVLTRLPLLYRIATTWTNRQLSSCEHYSSI